jgi:hypothetical protein
MSMAILLLLRLLLLLLLRRRTTQIPGWRKSGSRLRLLAGILETTHLLQQ